MNNEGNLEQLTEQEHLKTRNGIQKALLLASFHRVNNEDVSNPEAHEWFDAHAENFKRAFDIVLDEHPTFWEDVKGNFDEALELVKQKLTEVEEKSHV